MRFQAQASVYLDTFSSLDPSDLHDSARRWIRHSPFFPMVNELLKIARVLPVHPPDYLANRVQMLEGAFYQVCTLVPRAWQHLADEFDRLERPHRAQHTRTRYLFAKLGVNSKKEQGRGKGIRSDLV